jgi:hypothetical protein
VEWTEFVIPNLSGRFLSQEIQMKRQTVMRIVLIIGVAAGMIVIGWIALWLANGVWPVSGPTGDNIPPNIQKVTPVDGSLVAKAQGYCMNFLFRVGDGMGPDPVSRINAYLDGANITSNIDGMVDLMYPPITGTLCYKSDKSSNSLLRGWHTAKVIYTDVKNKRFVYTWRFRVGNE